MIDPNSKNKYIGHVENQEIIIFDEFVLESGKKLLSAPVAYKTWGTLNSERNNVIVICHALTGSSDVEDWWGPLLGPGRTFDTDKFFVFCGNVLGSPYGSASPCTIDPSVGERYGPHFPLTSIRDDVNLHKMVLDRLGVESVYFVIGGSMGGMQVLEWAFFGEQYVRNIIPIATSSRHSAWCISWGEAQRASIYSDPKYDNGHYSDTDPPMSGLSAARMTALLTYRSRDSFETRFGRKTMPIKSDVTDTVLNTECVIHNEESKNDAVDSGNNDEFAIYSAQSYLRYQGDKFNERFDANCYIAITRKLDSHDISRGRGELTEVLKSIKQPCLVIGIASDGLFTADEQRELGDSIPNAQTVIIESFEGHDGFLLEFVKMRILISAFIRERAPEYFVGEEFNSSEEIVVKDSKFGEDAEDLLRW